MGRKKKPSSPTTALLRPTPARPPPEPLPAHLSPPAPSPTDPAPTRPHPATPPTLPPPTPGRIHCSGRRFSCRNSDRRLPPLPLPPTNTPPSSSWAGRPIPAGGLLQISPVSPRSGPDHPDPSQLAPLVVAPPDHATACYSSGSTPRPSVLLPISSSGRLSPVREVGPSDLPIGRDAPASAPRPRPPSTGRRSTPRASLDPPPPAPSPPPVSGAIAASCLPTDEEKTRGGRQAHGGWATVPAQPTGLGPLAQTHLPPPPSHGLSPASPTARPSSQAPSAAGPPPPSQLDKAHQAPQPPLGGSFQLEAQWFPPPWRRPSFWVS